MTVVQDVVNVVKYSFHKIKDCCGECCDAISNCFSTPFSFCTFITIFISIIPFILMIVAVVQSSDLVCVQNI